MKYSFVYQQFVECKSSLKQEGAIVIYELSCCPDLYSIQSCNLLTSPLEFQNLIKMKFHHF